MADGSSQSVQQYLRTKKNIFSSETDKECGAPHEYVGAWNIRRSVLAPFSMPNSVYVQLSLSAKPENNRRAVVVITVSTIHGRCKFKAGSVPEGDGVSEPLRLQDTDVQYAPQGA